MKVYIVTRVDVDYVGECINFNSYDEAVEHIKKDFKAYKFNWEDRISMITGNTDMCFPIRECDGGEHEWDIHTIDV